MPPQPSKSNKYNVEEIYGCVESGDILGAIEHLDRAITAQPNCAHFYAERASFYVQLGNIQQAFAKRPLCGIADYDRAIAMQPDNRLFQSWRIQLIRPPAKVI